MRPARPTAIIGLGVAFALTLASPPASAAQKVGCPSSEKWMHVTVELAAQRIFEEANNNGFPDVQAVYDLLDAKYDKNQNGTMCIDPVLSPERNPNSELNWFYVRDDNSNGG